MKSRGEDPPDCINELVIVGEMGFLRLLGPWTVEKEGTKWTVILPVGKSIRGSNEGKAAVLIADCQAVGGGIIDVVHEPDGEENPYVVVDQYAKGVNPDG
jgi:hypothetical protein